MTENSEVIDVNEILSWISPDTDRLDWLDTATALKAGGYDFSLFDEWSSSGGDYSKAGTKSAWRSINHSGMARIKNPDAYLIAKAKKSGYQPAATIRTKSAEELKRERAAKQAQHEQEERDNEARAAAKAQRLWDASSPLNTNPYLFHKGAQAAGELRQLSTEQAQAILYGSQNYPLNGSKGPLEGDLLVYLIGDETGITTCQLLDGKGSKHNLKDGRKAGCWWSVESIGEEVLIAEGMATALSAYEATGVNTVVAVDAGGVLSVSKRLRELYPDLKITILGEPDKNTGATNKQHIKAQKAVDARLAMPTVGDDINDMHVEKGLEAVREAIEGASLSQDINGNRIDIDALVALDGREITAYEAITNHQGEKIDSPIGTGKLWVNTWGFSGKGEGNYLRVDIIGLEGGKKLIAEKKAADPNLKKKAPSVYANQYTGLELAKCALYLTLNKLKKFNPIFKRHDKWIMYMFPELEQPHRSRIIRLIDLHRKARARQAKNRFKTYPERGQHIRLKRKDGQVQWVGEIFKTNKSVIAFDMEHGTGKTAVGFKGAIRRAITGKNNVYLTLFQSLTYDAANRLMTEHYIDDKDKIAFFDQLNNGLTVCLPSLARADVEEHLTRIGVLCIDEIEQVLSCFAGGDDTIFSTYPKTVVYDKLKQIVTKAEYVYIADADVSEATIQWVCDVRGVKRDDVLHVTCEPSDKGYETELTYHESAHAVTGAISEIIEDLEGGEKVSIPVSSAKDGRRVHEALKAEGYHGNLYANEIGANDEELKKLLANPSEATLGLDYIVYTAKINTGVSIEHDLNGFCYVPHESPFFTVCHAIFNTISIPPTACLQSLRRVRYLKRFKLHVYFGKEINGNTPVKPIPTDLNGLINWQKDRGNADRDLFTEELEILLNKYGFNFRVVGGSTGNIISFKKADGLKIIKAEDIEQPHELVTTDRQGYENLRFEISELFNTVERFNDAPPINSINGEIIEAYQTDRHKQIPERYKRITNDQEDRGSENEALRIARELFNRSLKANIKPNEIERTMALVSSHWPTLRAGGYLPSDWNRRPPKKFGAGTLKAILEWWGLVVEVSQYSKGVNKLVVSLNATYVTIAKPEISAEPDASHEKEKRDREIIRLSVEEGLSVRQIAKELGCGKSTVDRVVQKESDKGVSQQVRNLPKSIYSNTENIPGGTLKKHPIQTTETTSPVPVSCSPKGAATQAKATTPTWATSKPSDDLRERVDILTNATIEGVRPEPFTHYADTSEPLREITITYDSACPYALKALSTYGSYNGRIEAEIETVTRVSFLSRKASNDPVYLDDWVAGMVETHKGIKQIKFKMSGDDWPTTINLMAA